MKSFVKTVIVSLWNFFAITGIFCTLSMVILSIVMAKTHHITPERVFNKLKQMSGMDLQDSQFPKKEIVSDQFMINYEPLPLPIEANIIPYGGNKFENRNIIRVGPERECKTPSQASNIVKNGDIIEIDAFVYKGDVAVWNADNLILRGVNGRVHLNANGKSAQNKGIWVIYGDNITIENIEFSNAAVKDKNGAGIRGHGSGLTIRYCAFHRNENGILAGNRGGDDTITVECSEFSDNGYGDGQSHSIYVNNKIDRFIFQYNYVHHTKIGHHVKSRAFTNIIRYNRIMDQDFGCSSMAIDIPNGGNALILGNIFHQSKYTDNHRIIKYQNIGNESPTGLYVVNNTVVSSVCGIFVDNRTTVSAFIVNNLIVGKLKVGMGKHSKHHNLSSDLSVFKDIAHYDFHLKPNTKPIDAGIDFVKKNGISLYPEKEYRHASSRIDRKHIGTIDVGAFEFNN